MFAIEIDRFSYFYELYSRCKNLFFSQDLAVLVDQAVYHRSYRILTYFNKILLLGTGKVLPKNFLLRNESISALESLVKAGVVLPERYYLYHLVYTTRSITTIAALMKSKVYQIDFMDWTNKLRSEQKSIFYETLQTQLLNS